MRAPSLGQRPDLAAISALLAAHHLEVLGGFHCAGAEESLPKGTESLLLIGPKQPGFWPHVTQSPEWRDGARDPLDRWSRKVIGRLACDLGGKALFPFGGPPWHPFHHWALRSGRIWASPTGLLLHAEQGLWLSFRGALALAWPLDLPPAATQPCAACAKPCLSACPVGALGAQDYNVPACHDYLDQDPGQICLNTGCQTRGACPVSARHARMVEQSSYHMRQFHS